MFRIRLHEEGGKRAASGPHCCRSPNNHDYREGCGICASQYPRGAVRMERESLCCLL